MFSSLITLAASLPLAFTLNTSWPYQTFTSAPFEPPVLSISHPLQTNSSIFFAPDGAPTHQVAPIITRADGTLIWNGPLQHAFNFGVQQYRNQSVLVAWNGTVFSEPLGRGYGYISLWDRHYNIIANVTLPGNFLNQIPGMIFESNVDLHEAVITSRGSMLVSANNVTQADLTSVGGPKDGWVVEAQVYEIDIASNEVLFQWKSLEHLDKLPFKDSLYKLGSDGLDGTSQSKAWGYFDLNSVAPYGDGGYLIGSRYLCSAIALTSSGSIEWHLSGYNGADFLLLPNASFCFQHDVRPHAITPTSVILTLHDNHNSPVAYGKVPTKGKALYLNFLTHTATLLSALAPNKPLYSYAMGSYQSLPDLSVFLTHGYIPKMGLYSPPPFSHLLSTLQFGATNTSETSTFSILPSPTFSYRAYLSPWIGCPLTPPSVALRAQSSVSGGVQIFISWNGATEVAEWEIYGGIESPSYITTVPVGSGFETVVDTYFVEFAQVRPVLRNLTRSGERVPRDCVAVESPLVFLPGLVD